MELDGGGFVLNGATPSSFQIDNFSKLVLVSVSEFCHTNTFDGNEMLARLDTFIMPMSLCAETYDPPEKTGPCCSVCDSCDSKQEQLAQLLAVGDGEFR